MNHTRITSIILEQNRFYVATKYKKQKKEVNSGKGFVMSPQKYQIRSIPKKPCRGYSVAGLKGGGRSGSKSAMNSPKSSFT